MKISEYVAELEKIREEHGDLEVEKEIDRYERITARSPTVAYRMILRGRERIPRFWLYEEGDRRGEKVVKV